MRAVIQKVSMASVVVEGEIVSSIKHGLCVLIGISSKDTEQDMEYIARKILHLRLFDSDNKKWDKNVMEKNYEVLCVSQFTLCGVLKGNKLDFHNAMSAEKSKSFYEEFLAHLKQSYQPEMIKDGVFQAYMQVNIQNDGPVTIEIESPSNIGNNVTSKERKNVNGS